MLTTVHPRSVAWVVQAHDIFPNGSLRSRPVDVDCLQIAHSEDVRMTSNAAGSQLRLGLDLNLPARIEESNDDDHRAHPPHIAKHLRAGQIDAGAHDVRDAAASLSKALLMISRDGLRAGVGITAAIGPDRCGPETKTQPPTRAARLMPTRDSQGEPGNTSLGSTRQLVSRRANRRRHRDDRQVDRFRYAGLRLLVVGCHCGISPALRPARGLEQEQTRDRLPGPRRPQAPPLATNPTAR